MKKILVSISILLIAAAAVYAATPTQNQALSKHPNLERALSFVEQAQQKIADAQKANEYDMGGHAQKAKSYLDEASEHLRMAAVAASQNKANNDKDNKGGINRPADTPDPNVDASKHPNIARAQA